MELGLCLLRISRLSLGQRDLQIKSLSLITHIGTINNISAAKLDSTAGFLFNPFAALLLEQRVLCFQFTCSETAAALMEGKHKVIAQIGYRTAHSTECAW
ncbi:hypothetical protein D3C80_1680060 [compost metagenome]